MSNAYVSSLAIYPLKSGAAIARQSVAVINTGLLGDRRFMLTKTDGTFVTGRTHPKITTIVCQYQDDILVLSHPSCETLTLNLATLPTAYHATSVWGNNVSGQGCGGIADQWLSELLGEPLRLLYFGDQSNRAVAGHDEHQVAFADGFPVLLTNDESLAHLNQRLVTPVAMDNFRPNITISGLPAWAEDEWAKIRIGEVLFDLPKPCSRCIFTTIDPATATLAPSLEPLKTLSTYRQQVKGTQVMFGENMLALNDGTINVGDKVELLKTKPRPVYVDNWQTSSVDHRLAKQLALSSKSVNTATEASAKKLLRCVQITAETADVKTFVFCAEPIERFNYLPGQFITISVVIEGKRYNRCYTLSSSPSKPDVISITVKRVTAGIVSNWLHDNFSVGSVLDSTAASGRFHLAENNRSKLLLLSAGSGVTPMLSIVRYITDLALAVDVHFHHSAKTAADLICFDQLQQLAKSQSNLSLSCNFSRQSALDNFPVNNRSGRLSGTMISDICPDFLQRDVFVCGPNDFMNNAKSLLTDLGLAPEQYAQESFVVNTTEVEVDQSSARYIVKFLKSAIEVDITGSKTILAAAEEAGIYPEYSCLAGICGSCNSQLVSGELHAPNAMAIDTEQQGNGEFLPCCSYARSDLEVDL